jgi:hypothetical protein
MNYTMKSPELHRESKGKIGISARCLTGGKEALSMVYTLGVALPYDRDR